jgi:hypothetical protein
MHGRNQHYNLNTNLSDSFASEANIKIEDFSSFEKLREGENGERPSVLLAKTADAMDELRY